MWCVCVVCVCGYRVGVCVCVYRVCIVCAGFYPDQTCHGIGAESLPYIHLTLTNITEASFPVSHVIL